MRKWYYGKTVLGDVALALVNTVLAAMLLGMILRLSGGTIGNGWIATGALFGVFFVREVFFSFRMHHVRRAKEKEA